MRSRGWLVGVAAIMMLDLGCSDESDSRASKAPAGSSTSAAPAAPGPSPGATPAPLPAPTPAASTEGDDLTPAQRIAAGRSVYNANCIACHAMDPRQDGALGPALAGSSRALIEARVLRAEYPDGYVPKRATRVMVPLPHLEPKLDELTAYLGSLK